MLKVYIVGGYNRDKIMGLNPKDTDYCVVGSCPKEMVSLGFKKVGADFPIFLNENGDEYALARTERKKGNGYNGFETYYGKELTIEDDLSRRDLTINAIALDQETGNFIDPFNGIKDIENKILRHIGDAFKEDPLRLLRVARFNARFSDFTIDKETMNEMKKIVKSGELENLTKERVCVETIKALSEKSPSTYFKVLNECGALDIIFPELKALDGVIQPEQYHPEGDVLTHTFMVLDEMSKISDDPVQRFSALVHDLGKAVTPKELLPRHHGHEEAGVPIVENLCDRLKFPKIYKEVASVITRQHGRMHKFNEMSPRKIDDMFIESGFNKQNAEFKVKTLILASYCDEKGRGFSEEHKNKIKLKAEVGTVFDSWKKIKAKTYFEEKGLNVKDQDVDNIIYQFRIRRISEIRKNMKNNEKTINMSM